MTDTDDLVAWLRACLDEMEAVATAGSPSDGTMWRTAHDGRTVESGLGDIVVYDEGSPTEEQAAHIALHDPRSTLARVEAERAVLAEHVEAGRIVSDDAWGWSYCSECGSGEPYEYPTLWPCLTVRHLAHGHRFDYPGYRDSWAPA